MRKKRKTPSGKNAPQRAAWAEVLRARRKALHLSQKEIGEYAGCGVAFLYELEQGKATVRLDKLLDVLEVLGLRLKMERGERGLVADPSLVGGSQLKVPEEESSR